MHPPGWYHASGDPDGTTRYWDGSAWVGAPAPTQQGVSRLGYELIPIDDSPALAGPAEMAAYNVAARPQVERPVSSYPLERFAAVGLIVFAFGILLGISIHNMVTLFPEPSETTGEVVQVRQSYNRRGDTLRIEVQSPEGTFYTGGRVRHMPIVSQGQVVQIDYSETTGGLVAIPALNEDRRAFGRFLWPAVGLAALCLGGGRWRYDQLRYGGNLSLAFLISLLVIGPMLGYFVVVDLADEFVSALTSAP